MRYLLILCLLFFSCTPYYIPSDQNCKIIINQNIRRGQIKSQVKRFWGFPEQTQTWRTNTGLMTTWKYEYCNYKILIKFKSNKVVSYQYKRINVKR